MFCHSRHKYGKKICENCDHIIFSLFDHDSVEAHHGNNGEDLVYITINGVKISVVWQKLITDLETYKRKSTTTITKTKSTPRLTREIIQQHDQHEQEHQLEEIEEQEEEIEIQIEEELEEEQEALEVEIEEEVEEEVEKETEQAIKPISSYEHDLSEQLLSTRTDTPTTDNTYTDEVLSDIEEDEDVFLDSSKSIVSQRQHITNEIITTEKDYLNDLEYIIEVSP